MAKKRIYYFLTIFLLFLLETSAGKVFGGNFNIPMLVVLAVISLAAALSFNEVLWFAFSAGLLGEIFSSYFFGARIFALVAIGLLAYLFADAFFAWKSNFVRTAILLGLAMVFYTVLVWGWGMAAAGVKLAAAPAFPIQTLSRVFWLVLVNLLFFYPVRAVFAVLTRD